MFLSINGPNRLTNRSSERNQLRMFNISARNQSKKLERGGGLVVSKLAFYTDDLSSNTAEAYSFFCKILFEKNKKINKKRPGLAH